MFVFSKCYLVLKKCTPAPCSLFFGADNYKTQPRHCHYFPAIQSMEEERDKYRPTIILVQRLPTTMEKSLLLVTSVVTVPKFQYSLPIPVKILGSNFGTKAKHKNKTQKQSQTKIQFTKINSILYAYLKLVMKVIKVWNTVNNFPSNLICLLIK